MKRHLFTPLVACAALYGLFLFLLTPSVHAASMDEEPVPVVALEPISPPPVEGLQYVGPAVTKMIGIRLQSQGIDVIRMPKDDEERRAAILKVSDLVLSGRVREAGQGFDLEAELRRADDPAADPLRTWQVRAPDLGILAQKTSLLTGQMADSIKDALAFLEAERQRQAMAAKAAEGGLAKNENDELEMARMHPDRLVRERLAKDQAREAAIARSGQTAESAKEDTRYWDPLPSPYYKENEELLEKDYHEEPVLQKSGNQEDDQGLLSSLWPFGDKEEQEAYEAAAAGDLDIDDLSSGSARRIPRDRLPVPPPEPIEFHIPEPQSVDQVLSSAKLIKKEKAKEEKWYSFLMPWQDDTEDYDIVLTDDQKAGGSQTEGEPGRAGIAGGTMTDSAAVTSMFGQTIKSISGGGAGEGAEADNTGEDTVSGKANTMTEPAGANTIDPPAATAPPVKEKASGPLWQWE